MRDYYRILDPPLGSGAYGEVRPCVYKDNILDVRSSIKSFRAVKVLSKSYMEDKEVRAFQNEVASLYLLDHPNILKLYHYFEDQQRYMLVTELIEGGELFKRMSSSGQHDRKMEGVEQAHILK